jgi:tryptophan-rich sensory protein
MDRITLRSVALAAVCILIPLVSGAVIGVLTMSGVTDWYTTLNKPWFTPPDYVFGPVWTVLYILMGISLYLVVIQGWENETVKTGIILFAAQLGVNLLWSVIFFGLQSPLGALACIFILLALIVATIITFYRLSKPAAVLLVPYLAWVCIATALNAAVVLLN